MNIKGPPNLRKIVVLNSKGGSGKTTLAFNIAGYIAASGRKVALIDMDPQGNSTFLLKRRPSTLPEIYGVSAPSPDVPDTRSSQTQINLPQDTDIAVIDSPGSLTPDSLADYTVGSHAILVPVLPSDLDIHAASKLIKDLLLVARVSRANRRLGVIANRVKRNTLSYRRLMNFLDQLSIAVVGVVRDSQNYVTGAHRGTCIHEFAPSQVKSDLAQWQSITEWLEQRLSTPLNERDLRRPESMADTVDETDRFDHRSRRNIVPFLAVACGLALVGIVTWFMGPMRQPAPTPDAAAPSSLADTGRTTDAVESQSLMSMTDDSATTAPGNELSFVPGIDELLTVRDDSPPDADLMREKWQLSGVAQTGKSNVVLLTDRTSLTTHRALPDTDIDGWLVAETGRDFAVLSRGDEVVRLMLNPPTED